MIVHRVLALVLASALGSGLSAQSQFIEFESFTTGPAPFAFGLAVADVDGDGDRDVITGPWGGSVRIFLNDGDGAFAERVAATPDDRIFTNELASGDLDRDGDTDVVVGNFDRQTKLLINDGTGTFSDGASRFPVDSGADAVAIGDLDRDGWGDIVAIYNGGTSLIYRNDRQGSFASTTPLPALPGVGRLVLVDVTGDDYLDAVVATFEGERLLINDGNGNLVVPPPNSLPPTQRPSRDVVVADVDNDGDRDAVFVAIGAAPRMLLNDGSGRFSDRGADSIPQFPSATVAALGDIDLDGNLDLVVGTWSDQPAALLLGDGTGKFTVIHNRLPNDIDGNLNFAFADLDDDGDPELVAGNQWTGLTRTPTRIYTNLHRHVRVPAPPRIGTDFGIALDSAPGYASEFAVAVPMISGESARVPVPPLGIFKLGPAGFIAAPPLVVPAPAGTIGRAFRVPNDSRLIGEELFVQAFLLYSTGPGHLTNAVRTIVE